MTKAKFKSKIIRIIQLKYLVENKKFEIPLENRMEGEPMIELATELGFVETEKMIKTRERLVELLQAINKLLKANDSAGEINKLQDKFDYFYFKYENLATEVVEQRRDDEFERAKIGRLITEAYIFRAGGNMMDYEEKVGQALQSASNSGYDDITQRYWIL